MCIRLRNAYVNTILRSAPGGFEPRSSSVDSRRYIHGGNGCELRVQGKELKFPCDYAVGARTHARGGRNGSPAATAGATASSSITAGRPTHLLNSLVHTHLGWSPRFGWLTPNYTASIFPSQLISYIWLMIHCKLPVRGRAK